MKQVIIKFLPVLLLALGVCAGCSSRTTSTVQQATIILDKTTSYRLKHSGVLDVNGRRMPLRGLLQLTPEKRHARVLIMNDMGMKLLVSEVKASQRSGVESRLIFLSPFLQGIPSFYEESVCCIYEMYLNNATNSKELLISRKAPQKIGNRTFYGHTIIRNKDKNYRLELFLNSGSMIRL